MITLGLIKGRHSMPVEAYCWDEGNPVPGSPIPKSIVLEAAMRDHDTVRVYATGLTRYVVAAMAQIYFEQVRESSCANVEFWLWDSVRETYVPEWVMSAEAILMPAIGLLPEKPE